MMNQKLTALLLSGALVCAMGTQALAAATGEAPDHTPAASTDVQKLPASVLYTGKVTEILKDEKGTITGLRLDSEDDGSYVMTISDETVWIDNQAFTADDPSDLAVGETLNVFRSPVSTRSLPPQSAAIAVVRNVVPDADRAIYHVVEAVEIQGDGNVRITTDNGGLYLFTDKETKAASYLANGSTDVTKLQAGDRIMAWYMAVALSYPGQAHPSSIMILPANTEKPELPDQGAKLSIQLNGKTSELTGRYENDVAMVPVAAVARALGLEAAYTRGQDGAVVTVESKEFSVNINIDQKLISGVTKLQGAVGATGPQDYGMAAYIEAPGTTWAPAELFTMLGKTVTLEGNILSIQ